MFLRKWYIKGYIAYIYSSRKIDDDEYEDLTVNQKWVLAPKTQDTDATLILNKLMKEYDKKLRPDIGGEFSVFFRLKYKK